MWQYEAFRRPLIEAAGPGHWNDPDMLLGGNFGLSWDQTRVQFGLWAMHASPLILSVDLATIRPELKEVCCVVVHGGGGTNCLYRLIFEFQVLQSEFVIRVNQDKLGKVSELLIPIDGIKVNRSLFRKTIREELANQNVYFHKKYLLE